MYPAFLDRESLADDRGDRGQRLIGPPDTERLRPKGRQPVHLVRAPSHFLGALPLPMQQLCGDDADDEKCDQDEPVERVADHEPVVGCEKVPVEKEEGRAGEGQAERASAPDAAGQDDEQVNERGMRLVQVRSEWEHGQRDRRQPQKRSDPGSRNSNPAGY